MIARVWILWLFISLKTSFSDKISLAYSVFQEENRFLFLFAGLRHESGPIEHEALPALEKIGSLVGTFHLPWKMSKGGFC